jgi:hypothetical protein
MTSLRRRVEVSATADDKGVKDDALDGFAKIREGR